MAPVNWQMRGQYMKNCNCVSSTEKQRTALSGTGAVKLQYRNTHSSLAEVEHTQKGLRA